MSSYPMQEGFPEVEQNDYRIEMPYSIEADGASEEDRQSRQRRRCHQIRNRCCVCIFFTGLFLIVAMFIIIIILLKILRIHLHLF